MAHAAGDAHEYPVYGAHFRLTFPIIDNDGDLVVGATGLDSERSIDGGTFADCTNEATQLATSSGMYYLDLTGAELTSKCTAVIVKTTSTDGKTTALVLYPRRLPIMESDTAQAGAAGTITLASGASAKDDFYNGLFVLITNNSPAGAQYQLRRIIDYVGSTKVATIDSNWGTNPSNASTYDILVPEGYDTKAWAGVKVSDPTTAGRPDVGVVAMASAVIAAATFAAGAIDAAAIATDALGALELSAGAVTEIVDAIVNTALTESYAADGAAPTLAQALFMILQNGGEFSISGTTLTVKKLDGTTTAMTFTLDSATNPTSRTRAT